jgi:hypothetical protein
VAAYYQDTEPPGFPTCASVTEIQNSLGVSLGALATGTGRIGSMSVTAAGVITATIANVDTSVNGQSLILSATANADNSITWNWSGGAGMPPAYVPRR